MKYTEKLGVETPHLKRSEDAHYFSDDINVRSNKSSIIVQCGEVHSFISSSLTQSSDVKKGRNVLNVSIMSDNGALRTTSFKHLKPPEVKVGKHKDVNKRK